VEMERKKRCDNFGPPEGDDGSKYILPKGGILLRLENAVVEAKNAIGRGGALAAVRESQPCISICLLYESCHWRERGIGCCSRGGNGPVLAGRQHWSEFLLLGPSLMGTMRQKGLKGGVGPRCNLIAGICCGAVKMDLEAADSRVRAKKLKASNSRKKRGDGAYAFPCRAR